MNRIRPLVKMARVVAGRRKVVEEGLGGVEDFRSCPMGKPSRLIRIALGHLMECSRDRRYKVDMHAWHEPMRTALGVGKGTRKVCHVCLAGAVMAKGLGEEAPGVFRTIAAFRKEADDELVMKLMALDSFRMGDVKQGLETLGIRRELIPMRPTTFWEENPAGFLRDMEGIAMDLEAAGY